jgi:hypothetical protein
MSQARLMDGTALARRIVEDTAKKAADLTDAPVRRPVWRRFWSARTRPPSPTSG